ncbi:MAG: hypothetical protein K9H64_03325 [Bacteroidales bacterium]|nr:hypothetical protein [Bacteroidales bacterium]MCF8454426.1 hypothetical protein [Bacteroidales bacterium]
MLIHLYNQGNNKVPIFYKKANYIFFLEKVRKHLYPHCDILAWCLMPNHFHFLLTRATAQSGGTANQSGATDNCSGATEKESDAPAVAPAGAPRPDKSPFSHNLRIMLSSYTQAINRQQGRSGSLFRQNSKLKYLNNTGPIFSKTNYGINMRIDYAFKCFQYIHQNPWKAGLVAKMEDWEFSSFRDYMGIRKGTLINKEKAYEIVNFDREDFFGQSYIIVDSSGIF